jgi:hypothetical protein
MSKATLLTYGGALLDVGYDGEVADQSIASIRSLINENASIIDYGCGVSRGTSGDGTCRPVQGDGTDQIVGISVKNPLGPASSDGNDTVNYAQYADVPVMAIGHIFAIAAEVTRRGDSVLALSAGGAGKSSPGALGSTVNGVASNTRVAVPNAVWETTTASGVVGLVFISGGEAGRTTT